MKKILILATAASLSLLSACAIDPYTGEEKVSHTGKGIGGGMAAGAIIGAIAGGGKGAAIGAASGAVLGGGIGYYMDRQEAKLRQRLEGTGVRVQRQGDNINLIMPGNITFASGAADINANFYSVLDSVGLVLAEFDKTGINVSGYTDSTGGFELNQNLSEQRANSVALYLQRVGVQANRIQARGFAKRNPIASNNTASGRAQNRRVEISIRPN
ncbi:MAG: OmpA family protein [Methyloprofundus sp.]|nr:OmpA family protein [Methyloprofundus sp.]